MAAAFIARWPDPPEDHHRNITRQLISHIMLPTQPGEQVAEQVADLHSRYLDREP